MNIRKVYRSSKGGILSGLYENAGFSSLRWTTNSGRNKLDLIRDKLEKLSGEERKKEAFYLAQDLRLIAQEKYGPRKNIKLDVQRERTYNEIMNFASSIISERDFAYYKFAEKNIVPWDTSKENQFETDRVRGIDWIGEPGVNMYVTSSEKIRSWGKKIFVSLFEDYIEDYKAKEKQSGRISWRFGSRRVQVDIGLESVLFGRGENRIAA